MDSSRTRNLQIDACKAFLIFLVVFGHVIEISNLQIAKTLYKIIYIIHMPMFVFLAGYFIKLNKKIIQDKIFYYFYLYIKWSIVYGLVLYLLNHAINSTVRP
jgi:fucose 4-O-acetylase-like acetyltransferase